MTGIEIHQHMTKRWGEINWDGTCKHRPRRVVVSLEVYALLFDLHVSLDPGGPLRFFGLLVDTDSQLPMWSFIFYS